jgi:hypothetical protein
MIEERPMSLFNDRERAFEQMFVHDEEARFRALAKRNRLLGQWAASQLGLTGEAADAYVREIRGWRYTHLGRSDSAEDVGDTGRSDDDRPLDRVVTSKGTRAAIRRTRAYWIMDIAGWRTPTLTVMLSP